MKRNISVLVFVVLATVVYAQSSNDIKFMNIEWGIGRDNVKEAMVNKGFTLIQEFDRGIMYKGRFSRYEIASIINVFYSGRYFETMVTMRPITNSTIGEYKLMLNEISQKYGSPQKNIMKYGYPYSENDGYEKQAILSGKVEYFSYWENDDNDTIVLSIAKDNTILLLYENGEIAREYDSRQKSDY